MNLANTLRRIGLADPGRPALYEGTRLRCSYGELAGRAARIAGARVVKVGTPLRRDVFYVSNHLSWIDILALGGASGTAFVAKAEIGAAPVVGWLAGMNRTVYVKRENRLGVADQINQLRDALADNWAITIFPEGTTTDGKSLLPFKIKSAKLKSKNPVGQIRFNAAKGRLAQAQATLRSAERRAEEGAPFDGEPRDDGTSAETAVSGRRGSAPAPAAARPEVEDQAGRPGHRARRRARSRHWPGRGAGRWRRRRSRVPLSPGSGPAGHSPC